MSFVPKPNTGTLWPNDRKNAANHPDVRGDVYIDRSFLRDMLDKSDGDLIRLQVAGWEKKIANKDCLSLNISAPYIKQDKQESSSREEAPEEDAPF